MSNSAFTMRRRWFLLLTLLTFGFALGIGAVLWHSVEANSVLAVQTRIDTFQPVMAGVRCSLIILVAITWAWVVSSLYRWGYTNALQTTNLIALRWRIVTWLEVIELVLGHNLIGQVLAQL